MNKDFAHLTTHSHYSLLSGIAKIKDLVKTAKDRGCSALALTDTNNMYASIEFYKECKKSGIKPILGTSIFIKSDNEFFRINLLAKNNTGYRNILKIVTNCNLNTDKDKFPHTTKKFIAEKSEGIIAIVPVINGEWSKYVNDSNKIKQNIDEYKEIFGGNLYLGVGNHSDIHQYDILKEKLIKESIVNNVAVVATQIIYFIDKEDKEVRNAVLKIRGNSINPILEESLEDANLAMPTKEEMSTMFDKESIENISKIVESVDVELKMNEFVFPDTGVDGDPSDLLRKKVFDSLEKMGLHNDKIAINRVEYELEIINKKGYVPYFLTVIDIVDYMHNNGVLTTTRGSSAGSMVAYLTKITNVDPIKNNLPFERFLNPFRPSAPDIDLDIADDKRDFVIAYITKRFGEKNVAQIGTFGTMKARAVVRDMARALGYPYITGDRIAKLIPIGKQGFPMTIDKAFTESEDFKNLYERDEEVRKIVDLAKKIEGNVRHISKHAAGVVIAPDKITNYTPLQPDTRERNKMITQFDMNAIEDIGLIKFDILGLTNLSILDDVVRRVNKKYNENIDLDEIPLEDKKTFDLLSEGKLAGIFQLGGSTGMKALTKRMMPSSIHDISVIIALYRPGPIQNIDRYIERKHGNKEVIYTHPSMANYLNKSYGILVYQDDILFTAIELAGYDWKEVDVLRKAIGKKIPELMKSEHQNFVDKCVKFSGIKREECEKIWDLFEPFQGYGFNKAHASAYAKIAYQTAYMKANYPEEYMAALLSAEMNDIDRVATLSRECKILGIKILPPSVNKSHSIFITSEEKDDISIIVGLGVIKNLGREIADIIVREREANGMYTSLSDFVKRISKQTPINKRFLEALIKTGCLDEFEERHILLANLEYILQYAKDSNNLEKNQLSLFEEGVLEDDDIKLVDANQIGIEQRLFWEKDFTGMYISSHPLRYYEAAKDTITYIKNNLPDKKNVKTIAVISELKRVRTRNGTDVTFVILEDEEDIIEAVVFSDTYDQFEEFLAKNRCVQLSGKVSYRNNDVSLVVEGILDPKTS